MNISVIFGWLSTLIWSASFYPQIRLNFVNQSTDGLCIDYAVYNLIGFSSYTYYNILAFFEFPVVMSITDKPIASNDCEGTERFVLRQISYSST